MVITIPNAIPAIKTTATPTPIEANYNLHISFLPNKYF